MQVIEIRRAARDRIGYAVFNVTHPFSQAIGLFHSYMNSLMNSVSGHPRYASFSEHVSFDDYVSSRRGNVNRN
jgi:hypothetical protein